MPRFSLDSPSSLGLALAGARTALESSGAAAKLPLRADTLTLTLSHQGRGDSLTALGAWFRWTCSSRERGSAGGESGLASLTIGAASFWIPAFAGMTGGTENDRGFARRRVEQARRAHGFQEFRNWAYPRDSRRRASFRAHARRAWLRFSALKSDFACYEYRNFL